MNTVRRFFKSQAVKTTIVPPLAGLLTAMVLLIGLNFQHIAAHMRPQPQLQKQDIQSQASTTLKSKPRLAIAALDINAPVIYGATTEDDTEFQKLLENGVVHYPATALPGEQGNTVIFGHSSNYWFAPGSYKSVFATLGELRAGDIIDISYQDSQYRYRVKEQKVVLPHDVSVLQPTEKPQLTLITCWPVGSTAERLIITANLL